MRARDLAALCLASLWVLPASAQDAPRIFLDQPERIVDYQLNRLASDVLVKVERRDTDVRYRPVYMAFLTREGVPRAVRDEAVAALVTLGAPSVSHVLMDASGRLVSEASSVADVLMSMALAQSADVLAQGRPLFEAAVDEASEANGRTRLAYAALVVTEPDPAVLWPRVARRSDHVRVLLEAVPGILAGPAAGRVRASVAGFVDRALRELALGAATRATALVALAAVSPDGDTASRLVLSLGDPDNEVAAGAGRALARLPSQVWAGADVQPAIDAITTRVRSRSPGERASGDAVDLLALAARLIAQLPPSRAAEARVALRALGAQVVRITALPEQVSFDVRWFAVEAGRAVQIVLVNPDAMPHNVVIGRPGSLQQIGTAAGAMSMPSDASIKAFVPDLPAVLFATKLVQQGGVERLGFLAPSQPGAYVFACTFPGHWVRMYGVMLVVPNLAEFDAAPEPPVDPMTGERLQSR